MHLKFKDYMFDFVVVLTKTSASPKYQIHPLLKCSD